MKVIRKFHDKYNLSKVYQVGDEFISDDLDRISNLISRGLIEGEQKPSIPSPKKEIVEISKKKKAK